MILRSQNMLRPFSITALVDGSSEGSHDMFTVMRKYDLEY